MEAAAKKFEQEEGILKEVQQKAESDDLYSYPFSKMFHSVREDGYSPYCEINMELNHKPAAKTWNRSGKSEYSCHIQPIQNQEAANFRSEHAETSVSDAASTICSFVKPIESSSTANNDVRRLPYC